MNARSDAPGAERAVGLLLAKLGGEVRTEIEPPTDRVAPPRRWPTLASHSSRSCPKRGACRRATPISCPPATPTCGSGTRSAASTRSRAGTYESVHAGFDTTAANADPNRLVPLDAARELEAGGRSGRLHDAFYTTSGVDTPVATAAKFGQEIAAELLGGEGRGGVVLTGT